MFAPFKRAGEQLRLGIPKPQRLRARLISILGGIILGIMVAMGTAIYIIVYQADASAWQGRQGEAARNAALTVSAFLQRAEDSLNLINLLDANTLNARPEVARSLFLQNESLLEVIRLDKGGRVLANAFQGKETVLGNLFTIPQSQWFAQAKAGKTYYGRVQISAVGRPYVLIALPAPDGGVVAARLSMDVLRAVVDDIRFGQTGRSYIVDKNGAIIAHTNARLMFENATVSGNPTFAAVLSAPANQWQGIFTNLEGVSVTGATTQVAGKDWIIFTEVTDAESYASSRSTLQALGLGILILSVLAMWASSRFLESLILRQVERMRVGAERIGSGDLTFRIGLEGRDEIGVVAAAFDRMAEQLHQRVEEVAQRTQELVTEVEVRKQAEAELHQSQAELEIRVAQRTDELAGTNRKLVILNQVSQELIRLAESDEILEMIRTAVSQVLETDSAVIALVDPATRQISVPVPITDGCEADFTELLRHVIRTGAPLLLSLDAADHLARLGITVKDEALKSLLVVPMLTGGRVSGIMLLRDGQQAGKFTMIDQELCVTFAAQAVIALENARLYKTAQKEIVERTQAEVRTREALNEREVLLKEIHHRVKNNLQVISSLLNLQASQMSDPVTVEALRISQARVRSMALIHEKLYQSNDLGRVDFGSYLHSLVNYLVQTYRVKSGNVTIRILSEKTLLDIDAAIPCGLIVNELVTNSLKYAFPNDTPGTIQVAFSRCEDGRCRLGVSDDGVGLPPEMDISKSRTLGFSLVNSLTRQVDGELVVEGKQGTRFEILFATNQIGMEANPK